MKRITTILLALCLCLSLFTASVCAAPAKKNHCDIFQTFLDTLYNGPGEFDTVEQKMRYVFELLATDEYRREQPKEGEEVPHGEYAIPSLVFLKKAISLFEVSPNDMRAYRLPEKDPKEDQIYYDAENDVFSGNKQGTNNTTSLQIIGYTEKGDQNYIAFAFEFDPNAGYTTEEEASAQANGKRVCEAKGRYYVPTEYWKVTLIYNSARARFVRQTIVDKLPSEEELITVGESMEEPTPAWILPVVIVVVVIGGAVAWFLIYNKKQLKRRRK